MTYALWTVQLLLALLFLGLGLMKVTTPTADLEAMMGLPGALIFFVGISELLGAFGLILPGLLKIKPMLTPLAALGLTIIAVSAMTFHVLTGDSVGALFPLTVAVLSGFVAYGRRSHAPLSPRTQRKTLQPVRSSR